jgi:putative redox protein
MATIKQKTTITMKMSAVGQTDARSQVRSRDVFSIIDEPAERGGSNLGLSPTETLMSALIGCTNVISKRIAHGMGITMGEMSINLTARFDRRGVMLTDEVDTPFSDIVLDIDVATDATDDQIETVKSELARFCPVAKVIRAAGTTITENWTTRPL